MRMKKRFTLALKNTLRFLPDKAYISLYFRFKLGYFPPLTNPFTYNEKLQWLKLNYHNSMLPHLVDKYEVRDYIRRKIGENYLIPLLGVYNSVDEINEEELPSSFVIKCTHDSQSTFVCHDKSNFDFEEVKRRLRIALRRNWYWQGREWAYKSCVPRIIVEEYLEEPGKMTPNDYKFYCFDGVVKMIQADACRFTDKHVEQFFSTEWDSWGDWDHLRIDDSQLIEKPSRLDDMVLLSEVLSQGFPHVRVDWYCVGEKLFFGELTFYTGGGFDPFHAKEDRRNDPLDRYLGESLVLPEQFVANRS